MMTPVLAMFGLGYWELLIVAGVVLLLFGHRLPSIMRSMGSGISQFKQGLAESTDEDFADMDAKDDGEPAKEKSADE